MAKKKVITPKPKKVKIETIIPEVIIKEEPIVEEVEEETLSPEVIIKEEPIVEEVEEETTLQLERKMLADPNLSGFRRKRILLLHPELA